MEIQEEEHVAMATPSSFGLQVKSAIDEGLSLDFAEAKINIPGKAQGSANLISLDGASLQIKLDELSLHGLNARLDAPIEYNGLKRELSIVLSQDQLYFSLDASQDENANYEFAYKASLDSYDLGEIDETTRGISYYEYGQLDYVLSEILIAMGIDSFSLSPSGMGSKILFDWDQILDSLEDLEEIDNHRFLWNLPVGEEVFPIGLVHEGDYVFSGVEFPLQTHPNDWASLRSGTQIRLKCTVKSASFDNILPREESDYISLADSLGLWKRLASFASKKSFGVDVSFVLSHGEDEVLGDESHFAHAAVNEECALNLSADCDFRDGLLGAAHVEASMSQSGGESKSLLLHTEEGIHEDGIDFFLNVNDILKVQTNSLIASALYESLIDALSDPTIQNDSIRETFSSLLSTANAITKAIDAFRDTSLVRHLNEGVYQDLLSPIVNIETSDNQIVLTIDLSAASLEGTATVILSGISASAPLAQVTLNHVGICSDNDTRTRFYLNGSLSLVDYRKHSIDVSSYKALDHLPEWTEEIRSIARRDQLQVQIEGYMLTLGTACNVVSQNASYGYHRNEQGFTFNGSIAFDLAQKLGTGKMVFTDRKESYVNDHSLTIDFTGEKEESDSDLNDMKGTGNHNAMFFEYHSRNVTAASGSSAFDSENRKDPDNKNGLRGRFSVHSLSGVLEVISDLTSSDDPRFARLVNLVGSLQAKTLLSNALDGEYFELLTSKILSQVDIEENRTTIVVAPGVIQPHQGATLTIGYDEDGLPSTIEISMVLEGDSNKEIYAKITLGSTSFDTFPFAFEDHNESSFQDYSSLKTLLEFGLGTITLGVTDTSRLTTYHLGGTAEIKVIGITTTVSVDAWIYLDGAAVKVIAAINMENNIAVNGDTSTNIFYETDGSDTAGTLYINRQVKRNNPEHRKVDGADFMDHLMEWMLKYILNFKDIITNAITNSDGSKKALHGEDIVEKLQVSSASLQNPSWDFSINLGALAGTSMLNSLTGTIYGKTATYSSAGKSYAKKTLYRLHGETSLLAGAISATLDFTVQNISSSGQYSDAWNNSGAFLYYYAKDTILFVPVENYKLSKRNGSAESLWNGSYGKTSANSSYVNASKYVAP